MPPSFSHDPWGQPPSHLSIRDINQGVANLLARMDSEQASQYQRYKSGCYKFNAPTRGTMCEHGMWTVGTEC
ncbi:MAG: hypothetical protein LBJ94_00455 [Puniceicoccales bacterium]|nr:hypothetical protein [Puniceicoccales bacterium]